MAAWGRMPRALFTLDVLFVLAAAVAVVFLWPRRRELRPWLVPGALAAAGLAICVDIHYMKTTGAAVLGWPLVWSLPMFPYRALGSRDTGVAWHIGTGLSLLFVALTVVAVPSLCRNATGKRWLGLLAAAFWSAWPLLVGVIAGHHAWTNNQWDIDVGRTTTTSRSRRCSSPLQPRFSYRRDGRRCGSRSPAARSASRRR